MQSLSEYTNLHTVNDMLRSFELKNDHENLEGQEDNLFDYFLQSTAWIPNYQNYLSCNTTDNTMPTCVWQKYNSQYCLQNELGSNTKRKNDIINNSHQKENKNKS
jgi:hypothetical protein